MATDWLRQGPMQSPGNEREQRPARRCCFLESLPVGSRDARARPPTLLSASESTDSHRRPIHARPWPRAGVTAPAFAAAREGDMRERAERSGWCTTTPPRVETTLRLSGRSDV